MTKANHWTGFNLALRLLRREWRSGELALISVALILAVAVTTSITLFSDRLQNAMQQQADQWLGADQRFSSSQPLPQHWLNLARQQNLALAQTVSFASMVFAKDELVLAAIKAVDQGYPLDADVRIQTTSQSTAIAATQGPEPGTAWAEPRLLAQLGLELGDQVSVGDQMLRITAIITRETDRGGNLYSLSPRLMVHWQDVINQQLLGPGSRATYRLMMSGSAEQLDNLNQQLQNELSTSPQVKKEGLSENNQAMANALEKAQQYLGLSSILAVVLAAIAIAVAAQRYSQRHYDVSAMLRTLGLTSNQVTRLFAIQLATIGIITTVCGALIALLLHSGLIIILGDLLPRPMPPASWSAWLIGGSSGLISLLGFAMPQLIPLGRVAPLRILRRELVPIPMGSLAIMMFAIVSLIILLSLLSGDPWLSTGVIGGGTILMGVLTGLIIISLNSIARRLQNRPLALRWRFAIQHWLRTPRLTAAQLLAITATLTIMILIANIRHDLLANWQQSLPNNAPNLFAINISEDELPSLQSRWQQGGLPSQDFFPVVPARLTHINQRDVTALDFANDNALQRDLILTQFDELPNSNQIIQGQWMTPQQTKQVSVEQNIAQRLQLNLGDQLTFKANGVEVTATITSIRRVDWTSMSPNFFMMLSADVLQQWPTTYLTSVHVPDDQANQIIQWMRAYPAVTFLDTRHLIEQVQIVISRVTTAIECVLVAVLLAALLVTLAILIAAAPQRLQEAAILRTLGASRRQIQQSQWLEFCLFGGISAVMALLISELLQSWLYWQVFNLPVTSNGWLWLWLPPLAALLLTLISRIVIRRSVQLPPQQVLRQLL